MSKLADAYEKRYPGTGASEAQKEARMERMLFKEERRSLHRTSRTNSFVVPELPWHRDKDAEGEATTDLSNASKEQTHGS